MCRTTQGTVKGQFDGFVAWKGFFDSLHHIEFVWLPGAVSSVVAKTDGIVFFCFRQFDNCGRVVGKKGFRNNLLIPLIDKVIMVAYLFVAPAACVGLLDKSDLDRPRCEGNHRQVKHENQAKGEYRQQFFSHFTATSLFLEVSARSTMAAIRAAAPAM
ncbi:hypothetical protein SDC9_191823 [bioreactor metagenome]|uniref:Uncharacterized protein n=1 Tax=bioreactor metagenome TaxID=1076179 RepID=A0A645HYY6_9ZZZZ